MRSKQLVLEIDAPEPDLWSSRAKMIGGRSEIVSDGILRACFAAHLRTRGGDTSLRPAPSSIERAELDYDAITALKRAHWELQSRDIRVGAVKLKASSALPERCYKDVALAFLAPDIQKRILEGRQPDMSRLKRLIVRGIPTSWAEQRALLESPT